MGNAVRETKAYLSLPRFEGQRGRALATRKEVAVNEQRARLLVKPLIDGAIIHDSPITNLHFYMRGTGLGRGLGVGAVLGVPVGVGVGGVNCAQYLPPVFKWSPFHPPQTIISLPVQIAA